MSEVRWERYPLVAAIPQVQTWLTIQADLGLAPNTIEAYGRSLQDYLSFSKDRGADHVSVSREHIAAYVRDLSRRPNPRGANVRVLDSGVGLANATLQQRLTAVRLYYDYLVEEGIRVDNPVGRGRYTLGKGFGGARERGLLPRFHRLPWIPIDEQWRAVLDAAQEEPRCNRLMLALAYDAALRRYRSGSSRSAQTWRSSSRSITSDPRHSGAGGQPRGDRGTLSPGVVDKSSSSMLSRAQ